VGLFLWSLTWHTHIPSKPPREGAEDIKLKLLQQIHKEILIMKSTIDIVLISTLGFLLILAGFDNIQRGYTPYWAFLLCAAGLFIIWWPHVCNLSDD